MGDCIPWEGPSAGAEECEEGVVKTMCDELTITAAPE